MLDLLYVISYIRYLYKQIEYLEENNQKNSVEYNNLIKELEKEIKVEKDMLNLFRNHFGELKTKLKEEYPFLKNGISISPKDTKDKYLIALRLMNELISSETVLNKYDYEHGLSQYLTIDELSLSLNNTPRLKFLIGFLVPDIEQVLLTNNFEVPTYPIIYNETIKDIYNISDEYHEKYKDKILLYRYKKILEKIIMASDEDINNFIEYYTNLKYILIAIYSLCSNSLLKDLDELTNQYLINSKNKSKELLNDIITNRKRQRFLKVTFEVPNGRY